MNTPSKPRLEIYAISDAGGRQLIGDFADGPRGRKDADHALNEELKGLEVRAVLYPQNTFNDVAVERVFSDGYRQPLLRVPGSEDDAPTTGEEALSMEWRRTRAFLDGKNAQAGSRPLTCLEERAYETMGKQSHPDWLAVDELVEDSVRRSKAMVVKEALTAVAEQSRPSQSDLADPEEVRARRSRGRFM
ncbi:MAG: hypothetical protein EOO16_03210 [Chitinophagaceae bacterium]|jgi:hypothetical protein|nr:MAG: hypothetical protein EOO16_03210 [Chitinophagaceae bacterium]